MPDTMTADALRARCARRPLVNPGKPMPSDSPRTSSALLKLEPNQTCGFVRETYVSALKIAPGGLPVPFATGAPPAQRSIS